MGLCFSIMNGVDSPDEGLASCFQVMRKIGEGAEGSVWLAHSSIGREDVAIKLIPRGGNCNWPTNQLECEVLLQSKTGHANVCMVKSVLLTANHFGIVTEYVDGGNLRAFCKETRVSERVACFFMRQLINAIKHLHQQGIAHRDIKLSNVLMDITSQNLPVLKLTDFGCSKQWNVRHPGRANSFTGTLGYMPPEVLDIGSGSEGSYDAREVDVWALGVSLIEMLSGTYLPFSVTDAAQLPDDARQVYQQYLEHNVPWYNANKHVSQAYTKFSSNLKNLLDGMLNPDPSKRLSLKQVEEHAWIQQQLPKEFQRVLDWLDAQQAARKEQALAHNQSSTDADISQKAQRVLHDMVLVSQLRSPLPHGEAMWLFDPRSSSGRVFTRFMALRSRLTPPSLQQQQQQQQQNLAHAKPHSELYDALMADGVDCNASDEEVVQPSPLLQRLPSRKLSLQRLPSGKMPVLDDLSNKL